MRETEPTEDLRPRSCAEQSEDMFRRAVGIHGTLQGPLGAEMAELLVEALREVATIAGDLADSIADELEHHKQAERN